MMWDRNRQSIRKANAATVASLESWILTRLLWRISAYIIVVLFGSVKVDKPCRALSCNFHSLVLHCRT